MRTFALEGPIETPSQDLLGRAGRADAVAEMLTAEGDAGFVVSLEGAWGSGKTSVLNLVRHRLQSMPRETAPIVISFSPWLVGDGAALVREFLRQLSFGMRKPRTQELIGKSIKAMEVAEKITKYLRYVPGAGPLREDLKEFGDAISATKDVVKAAQDGMHIEDVSQLKQDVVEALAQLDRAIVVVIDDVDRLPPRDVYEVIRLVRAVGDFPRVRYVLAIDPEYVEGALDKCGVSQAANFLDKIFLNRFSLPTVFSEQMEAMLRSRLGSIADEVRAKRELLHYEARLNQLVHAGWATLFTSIRDIKVVANRVRLHAHLSEEVNLAELAALETLAIKAPTVYRNILQHPEQYTGAVRRGLGDLCSTEVWESTQVERQKALLGVSDTARSAVDRVLDDLFCEAWVSRGSSTAGAPGHAQAVAQGRLCGPSRLRIAVSGTVPTSDIWLRDVTRFVHSPDRRGEVVNEVSRKMGLARFGWLLAGIIRSTDVDDPSNALQNFGALLDNLHSQPIVGSPDPIVPTLEEVFQRLRRQSRQGGEPLLRGRYGITLSYWEIKLLRGDDPERLEGLSYQRAPGETHEQTATRWESLPTRAGEFWLAFIEPRLASGACGQLADLRSMCLLRNELLTGPATDTGGDVIPQELRWSFNSDVDRFGRAFQEPVHTLSHSEMQTARIHLARTDLRPYQRAALTAMLNEARVRNSDMSLVDLADVAPRYDRGSKPTWLAAY